ncbi:farnesyl diphosphate synthase [uncultured Desulfuromonas sp.]|uniref:polyprenyl synthetase family protein n=1 Tax=uncultured Desulfuromonas sp. TaxID=181013 RepID=UPI002AABF326|nr:farnesyl diphosphate synthase [uncultured Desulfuromonas sp.]
MDLKNYLSSQRQRVELALAQTLPPKQQHPTQLHEAMHYSVFAGGKRLRPILMMAACEAVGGDVESVLPAACAMEMIHTYSLIHDDLPAMDDDDLRRGQPTNHKVFGEATAILAGDALLTEAFVVLSASSQAAQINDRTRREVIQLIARAAGAAGMVGGQIVDMEAEGMDQPDLATVDYIHAHKTGALILASIRAGALLGGADTEHYEALSRFGKLAGLAFQIADDILDITGDQEQLGKDIGSDQERGKATYPAVLGLSESIRRTTELHQQALKALEPLGDAAEPLRQISHYIIHRSS